MKIFNFLVLLFLIFISIINQTESTITKVDTNINNNNNKSPVNKLEARIYAPKDAEFSSFRIKLKDINNYNEITEIPTKDGYFAFVNISMGLYSLEIESMQYLFPEYKVDILGGKKSIKVRPADNETAVIPLPLKIKAIQKIPYFQQHVPFSIFSIIQNPMIISTLLPVVLIFILPKMTSFITSDEETREQLKASTPTLIQQVPDWPKFKVITNKQIE